MYVYLWASQVVLMIRNLTGIAGDTEELGDSGSIPGLGRSPGEEHGNPLQYSCLENPMDRGAWWATVHGGCKKLDTTEATQYAHACISMCMYIYDIHCIPIWYMPF